MILALGRSDPGVVIGILVVLAVVVVPLFIRHQVGAVRAFLRTCDDVAAKLGGRREGGGILEEPEIHFRLEGRRAILGFHAGSKHEPAFTRVTVELGGRSPGTFRLSPQGFGAVLAKLFGAQDLEVGDPAFDGEYVIKANPPSLATEIFRPDRRRDVIRTVRRIAEHASPLVELTGSTLTVQTRAKLDRGDCLLDLVKAAGDFLGFVFAAPSGIEWVEGTPTSPGRCQVCGSELLERVVRCASCRTPHHRECWDYARECSTFACRERRFVS